LYESGLIFKDTTVIALAGAHLARADLFEANLNEANLYGAYLARARLMRAKLSGADLGDAKLFGADLREAKLDGANLRGAVLMSAGHGTPLPGASLEFLIRPKGRLIDAGPKNADLSGADLSAADLTDAEVSEEQLRSAEPAPTLTGATMPNGQKYEDWLKSNGSGEDRDNGGSS
jgi:uncharacterized protein YjbI with pentapeptide repeats